MSLARASLRRLLEASSLQFSAVRASGPGGQHVNKVSTAVLLQLDIHQSCLPAHVKRCLLQLSDQRISRQGLVQIKSQQHRSQERNKIAAVERLLDLIEENCQPQKPRLATRPSQAAKRKRLAQKTHRSKIKSKRGRVQGGDD